VIDNAGSGHIEGSPWAGSQQGPSMSSGSESITVKLHASPLGFTGDTWYVGRRSLPTVCLVNIDLATVALLAVAIFLVTLGRRSGVHVL
jgi:hypothetical protein